MKSTYAAQFNHDPIALGYDEHVQKENHPVRAGYEALLRWVGEKALGSKIVIDLGCGTGNTSASLPDCDAIYCVDISENMQEIAKKKIGDDKNVFFVQSDMLGTWENALIPKMVDTVCSTYAIHHLTQEEKHLLFQEISLHLNGTGKVIFGDLMFENREQEQYMREKYPELAADFDEELYWSVDEEVQVLQNLGFQVEVKRFSDLSWGIYGEKIDSIKK